MTVVKVTGAINGIDCTFTQDSVDVWSIQAPTAYPDGSYICEIWAEDESGNIGYATARLWIYDGRCTKIEWLDDPYQVKALGDGFSTMHIGDGMRVMLKCDGYSVFYIETPFRIHFLRCSEV